MVLLHRATWLAPVRTGRILVTSFARTRQLVTDRDFTDLDTTTEPDHRDIDILRDGPPVRHEYAPHRHGLALLLRHLSE